MDDRKFNHMCVNEKPYCSRYRNPYIILLVFVGLMTALLEIMPLFNSQVKSLHSEIFQYVMINTNVTVSAFGALIIYLCLIDYSRLELWLVLVSGAALDTYLILQRLNYLTVDGQILYVGAGFFPFVLIAVLWHCICKFRENNSADLIKNIEVLALCAAMPLIYMCSGLVVGYDPYVYDSMLFAADSMFGTQVSFWVTRAVYSIKIVLGFNYAVYFYLAMFMLLAQLACYKRASSQSELVQPTVIPAWLYICAGVLGALCYRYFPAVGTEVFFGTKIFPDGPIPAVASIPHVIQGPPHYARNAMPSLHLSWILCAYFSVCRLKKIYNYIGICLVFAVLISAFAVGKHWMTDFVVALPFTAMCLGITSGGAEQKWRWLALILGGSSCFGLMSLYKYNIVWVMQHQFIYLLLIFLIDVLAWRLCLQLLPKSNREISRQQE